MFFDLTDPELVGESTPDPLRFAFIKKSAPHAGGMAELVASNAIQSSLQRVYQSANAASSAPRCLYIHIPFCRVRCTYCNFFQYASSTELMNDYVDALLAEMRWKAAMPWSQAAPFHAVYIGGGTPTDLSAAQIRRLIATVKQLFPLAVDCEITLEGRVNGLTVEKFEAALEGGANRFSLGVQSFNTQVRRKAKRLDDGEVVIAAINAYADYNAAPIVIDLLYGLPYQTLEIWQNDLATYLDCGADGVDLYQLINMKSLPMHELIAKGKLPAAASSQLKASMFEMGMGFMQAHHQKRLSINHFAKNNRERSLYNSLAKSSAEILPLGAGGGGNLGGLQMMQQRDLPGYFAAIEQQAFPVTMLMRTDAQHQINGVIKAAFDKGVLSAATFDAAAGAGSFAALRPLFFAWQKNGLATLERTSLGHQFLHLTLAGQFWNVTLSQNLISVLAQNAQAA